MATSVMARWCFGICITFVIAACAKTPKQADPVDFATIDAILSKQPLPSAEAPDKALVEKISRCWNPPIFPTTGEPIPQPVRLKVNFNPDGTLKSAPKVLSKVSTDRDRLLADSAIRAVRKCEPFKVSEKWLWPEGVIFTLDARNLFN